MCELFAMCSRLPADVTISLEELASHGGRTGPNRDGWGVAYYDEGDVRLMKGAGPASESACVRFIEERHASTLVVAHIRKATQGSVKLANSQPLAREFGGRMHVFAHNGDVPGVFEDSRFQLDRFYPIGDTDSEYAFCALLARLTPVWAGHNVPATEERIRVVTDFACELQELGAANFVYSDAKALFVHSHRRRWPPDDHLRPPGLHVLQRSCRRVAPPVLAYPGVRVESAHAGQAVTLVASVPLSDEPWVPLAEGEVHVFEAGATVATAVAERPAKAD
jgi:glutamine amidotransferase